MIASFQASIPQDHRKFQQKNNNRMTTLRIIFLVFVFVHPKPNETIKMPFFKPLPPDIQPENYYLTIFINTKTVNGFYYRGHVIIRLLCKEQTNTIVLNQYQLRIDSDSIEVFALSKEGRRSIEVINKFKAEDYDADEYKIILGEDLFKGQFYETKIWFYKDAPNVFASKRELVYNTWYKNGILSPNKLNGMGARDILPCFDQINMKAKFEVRLNHDYTATALSNSALASTIDSPSTETKADIFDSTGKITTYSLAIVFLDLTYYHKELFVTFAEQKISNKMFYQNIGELHELDGTHNIIRNIIEHFVTLFTVPLKKLDVVFLWESTTLSYYGFIFMSYDDAGAFVRETSMSEKYALYCTVCKAISKQWIGYMVSMSHWYENWLIFGLNNFLKVLCANKFLKDSNRFSQAETVNSFLEVLEAESEGRHNPIALLHKPKSESIVYDDATVNKVYHLIRMMNFFLSSEVFEQGVEKLVTHQKFEVSTVIIIWNTFTTAAKNYKARTGKLEVLPDKFTVDKIMDSWTNQNGLPLIWVTRNDASSVTVKQEPFPSLYKMKEDEPAGKCWNIPLSFTTKTEHEFENVVVREWLTCDSTSITVTIPNMTTDDWFLFNLNMSVLGRVNYDKRNWRQIRESLLYEKDFSGIDVSTRANLVSDLFALAEIGARPYGPVFDTMKYLMREEHYVVWKVAAMALERIWISLRGTKLLEPFEKYVETILEPIFEKKEYKFYTVNDLASNKEDMKSLLKGLFLELSCKFNTKICQKISEFFINMWETEPKDEWSTIIPSNINKAIHCQGFKDRNGSYRKKISALYSKSTNEDDHTILIQIQSCTQNSKSLARLLKVSLDQTSENTAAILKTFVTNKQGYQIMKNHFQKLLKSAEKSISFDYTKLREYLYILLDNTNIDDDLTQMVLFAEKLNPFITIDHNSINFDKADRNIKWLRTFTQELTLYFDKPQGKNGSKLKGTQSITSRLKAGLSYLAPKSQQVGPEAQQGFGIPY